MLGPLEVRIAGRPIELRSQRSRAALALLVLHRDDVVPLELIAQRLWGPTPPRTAVAAIRNVVSGLRRDIAPSEHVVLDTLDGGYRLRLPSADLDLDAFDAEVAHARVRAAAGDGERAVAHLDAALRLWRGPALADLAFAGFAWPEIADLDRTRLAANEQRLLQQLAIGDHEAVLPEVERLVLEHPEREDLHRARIIALHGAGRRLDATKAYLWARGVLGEATGHAPSRRLDEAHHGLFQNERAADRDAQEAAVGTGSLAGSGSSVGAQRQEGNGERDAEASTEAVHELHSVVVLCVTGTDERACLTRTVEAFDGTVDGWHDDVFVACFGLPEPTRSAQSGDRAADAPADPRSSTIERVATCAIAIQRECTTGSDAIDALETAPPTCVVARGTVIRVLGAGGRSTRSEGRPWIAGGVLDDAARWAREALPGTITVR